MPVKISSMVSLDPRSITLAEYELGRENFGLHYSKEPGPESNVFGGQDFSVPWQSLYDAVHDFYTTNGFDPETIALRFVHCFHEDSNCLRLRVQICRLDAPYFNPEGYEVFPLNTTPCAWYELTQDAVLPTEDQDLKGAEYFDALYYLAIDGSGVYEQLCDGDNKYVENITYPWASEIYQMYVDNGSPANADIHFASCSYTTPPADANVVWPHGSVMYLSVGGDPLLNNDVSFIVIFNNKGADNGTLCPPDCGVYINPVLPE